MDELLEANEAPQIDAATQIQQFQEFLKTHYEAELLEQVRTKKDTLPVDFDLLSKFNPDLATLLLEEPENTIKAAEVAVEKLEKAKDFVLRFYNLPTSQSVAIRDIRSKHLGKFMMVRGIVRQKSDVRPQVTSARFECPSCGNVIAVLQVDTKFREPDRCGCGRKGKFRLLSQELVDAQKIVLEEAPDELEGGEQPKRMNVFLRKDLVSPITDKRTNPGSKIEVTGYLKEVPIVLQSGGKSTRYDLMIESNHVEPVEEDFTQINISEEEEEEILKIARDPSVFEMLTKSLAPSIFGHNRIKEAIMLQLLGGVKKARSDGVKTRGDVHVLLVGDPGSGKCIKGDSDILLANGEILSIEELFERAEKTQETETSFLPKKKIEVLSLGKTGKITTKSIKRLWKRKVGKLLRIKTSSGNVLKVTQDHPLFTTRNGLIIPIPAKQTHEGMYIATPRKVYTKGKQQLLAPVINRAKANKIIFPKELNEKFARLAGLLAGDGYLAKTKTSAIISLVNEEEAIVEQYCQLMEELFGLMPKPRAKKGTEAKSYDVYSITLYEFLQKNVPEIVCKAENKSIPKKVLQSDNNILSEFFSGLFDTDGHCNKTKRSLEITLKTKKLIDQAKICLLRFGIVARTRLVEKCATNTKEKIKRTYYQLTINGKFAGKFFAHVHCISKKPENLPQVKGNTNVDIIPGTKQLLQALRKKANLFQKDFGMPRTTYMYYERGDRNPSRRNLVQIAKIYEQSQVEQADFIKTIAHTDVFWDPIEEITSIIGEVDVYDFEIDDVHNFIASACIIHNSQLIKRCEKVAPKSRFVSGKGASGAGLTASVVRDEFLKGWALEAGALVLANRGFCLTENTEIRTPTGFETVKQIVEEHNQGRTKKVSSIEYESLKTITTSVKYVSSRKDDVYRIKVENGDSLEITKEHPVLMWDNGYFWKDAGKIKEGDYVLTKRQFNLPTQYPFTVDCMPDNTFVSFDVKSHIPNHKTKDTMKLGIPKHRLYKGNKLLLGDVKKIAQYHCVEFDDIKEEIIVEDLPKKITANMGEILGLLATDGHLPEKKGIIFFHNTSDELLKKYISLVQKAFNKIPTISIAEGRSCKCAHFSSVNVKALLKHFGVVCGNKTKKPADFTRIRSMPKEFVEAFFSGIINGDGSVSARKTGGTVSVVGGNKHTLEQIRKVVRPLGILAKVRGYIAYRGGVVKKKKRKLYKLNIAGISNIRRIKQKYLVEKKRNNIKKILEGRDLSCKIPKVNSLYRELNNQIPHYEKKVLYENGIKHSQLQTMSISRSAFVKSTKQLAEMNPAKYTDQIKLFQNIIKEDMIMLKVVKKEAIGKQTVYNIQVDMKRNPNYFANNICVHNCMIDELDKMSHEDRSAFHEALEQQCYHADTELLLADGTVRKIGEFVDSLMGTNKENIIQGHNCEILPTNRVNLLTTDFERTYPVRAKNISRHVAPNHFIKITYSSGRSITVTPEHPVFIFKDGIATTRADELAVGSLCPAPKEGDKPSEAVTKEIEKLTYKRKQTIEKIMRGEITFVSVKKVEKILNKNQKWVYDVQVEPTHAFISEGLVLHNTVTISKANIQATLRCETVVLAAANPKFGRFDPYELLAKQIDLPPALINRFDLIFPVRDLPSPEKDTKMADFILRLHQTGDVEEVPIETETLTKYVAYARTRCFPVLTEGALKEIQKFYVDMRNSEGSGDGISAIPISARQLEALVRLSEASARSRLSNEVSVDDAKRAIDLVMYCLKQLGVDPDTGKIDIDRLTTGVSASSRNQIHVMKEIIRELSEMLNNPLVSEEEILAKAKEKKIDEDKAEEILEKLNRLGDIFRPKPGFYSMMK